MEIGGIYHHSVEGVCVLADILPNKYLFYAFDIGAEHESNQLEPREFLTAKTDLPKTHIPIIIRVNSFTFRSIIFFMRSAKVHWGYSLYKDDNRFFNIEMPDGSYTKAHVGVCFSVLEDCRGTASKLIDVEAVA